MGIDLAATRYMFTVSFVLLFFQSWGFTQASPPPTQNDVTPQKVFSVFQKHPQWISINFGYENYTKLWKLEGNKLVEITKATQTCSGDSWKHGEIELKHDEYLSPEESDIGSNCDVATIYEDSFRILPGDRIQVYFSYHKFLLFFPATESRSRRPVTNTEINLLTAPLGVSAENLVVQQFPLDEASYYHYDISKTMPVFLDQSFPEIFKTQLQAAISSWNQAFGKEFLVLHSERHSLQETDCLSSRKICVFWVGGDIIPWTLVGGMAPISPHPQTGEIIGGFLKFFNTRKPNKQNLVNSDVKRFLSGEKSIDLFASMSLNLADYHKHRHPSQETALMHRFTHELGHTLGLAHNFTGSNTDISEITKSVMDYVPFPAEAHLDSSIGEFDKNVFDFLYHGKKLSGNFEYCDPESSYGENIRCTRRVVGPSHIWYTTLAQKSPQGVFGTLVSYGWHPRGELKIIDYLIPFISGGTSEPDQTAFVESFLCRLESLKEVQKYLNSKNVTLDCP